MTAAHKRLKVCSSSSRMKADILQGATIYRSIVYGSHATPLTHLKNPPENVNETHTHQWTVSVHGPGNSDVSHFIKKVVFKLHDSFAAPNRCNLPLSRRLDIMSAWIRCPLFLSIVDFVFPWAQLICNKVLTWC